jgi:hypothetical protein
MRALSTAELLSAWEASAPLPPPQRALALLSIAGADDAEAGAQLDDVASLSIGQRDGRLLALREQTFGSRLSSLAMCPACGERLQFELAIPDLRVELSLGATEPLELRQHDYAVGFRLPNSLDLLSLDPSANPDANRKQLLRRCVASATKGGTPVVSDELPSEVAEAIAAKMAEADPQADLQLAMVCPQCAHRWTTTFDIASFFWTELNAWAIRLLREVHTLASVYGWSEAEILGLSPTRRKAYLEMNSP